MREKYRELSFYSHRIRVRIEGFKIDRLLDKAMKSGLDIKDVFMISETEIICLITPADLKKLKKTARALYKFTVEGEMGIGYKTKRYLKSPVKLLGTILAVGLVIIQSLFINEVEVKGYKGIPETELRRCLKEQGIYKGSYRPSIDWDKAREELYRVFPQITWLRLGYTGRLTILDIAESDNKAYIETNDEDEFTKEAYCDIVADVSGYIDDISTFYGLAMAEKGDFVKKGQVIISGRVPIEPTTFSEDDPKEYFVRASGEIWANVPYRLKFNQERYLWDNINIRADSKKNIVSNKVEKTKEEAEKKVNQQIRLWVKENLPQNAQIVNKGLNFSYKKNIIEVGVTLEVRRQIGKEQETLIGETDSNTGVYRQN